VALVEVIAGPDLCVRGAQLLGELGLALEADLERRALEPADREDLALDLEDGGLGTEGALLDGTREAAAELPQAPGGHVRSPSTCQS
jgi:hypothetical protein